MKEIKNILMVYPQVPRETYWSFAHSLSFIRKKSSMPPLGLVTIASYIPKNFRLKLVDLNIERLQDHDLDWADCVFVSAMIVQKDSFEQVVARANAKNKTVVAGGPYVTSSHEKVTGVDHFVLGEAEEVMDELMADLAAGTARQVYKADKRPDLALTRVPRFELLKLKAYASMSIQYSRGCPFTCEFCDIWAVYGNRPRLKSARNVIAELQALHNLGWHGAVFMVDDNFIGNKGRVKRELLPAMVKWQKEKRFPFRFYTEASINLARDEALLGLMRDAAFNEVFIGIETPSAEALAETGKRQNLACDLAESVKKIQSFGIEVMAGFILGFDSDTEEIADQQIDFINRANIPRAMVGLLMALPGTKLHERLEREGRMLSDAGGNNTHVLDANFKTRLDPGTLRQGYRKVLGTIYDPTMKNYFSRCNRLLDQIDKGGYAPRDMRFAEIMALVRSVTRQPFTRYGWQYLKFIARNFVKNNRTFAEAVKFSIVGHHFHQITRQTLASA